MRFLTSRTPVAAIAVAAFFTLAFSPLDAEAASPVVTASAPSGMTADPAPWVGYTVQDTDGDIDRVLCAVDPPTPINPAVLAGFTPCPASPYRLSPLADGNHSFFVVAQDVVGNFGYALRNFATDATGPAITVNGVVEGQRFAAAWPPISVSASDPGTGVSSTSCAYDGATPSGCSAPSFVNQPLLDGQHALNVVATDHVGNVSSRSVRFSVEVPGRWTPSLAAPKKAKFKVKRGKLKSGKFATRLTAAFALPAGSSSTSCRGTAKISALVKKKRVTTVRVKFNMAGNQCVATANAKIAKRYKGKKLSLTLAYASGPISAFSVRGSGKL
jgi:hypothetical protein